MMFTCVPSCADPRHAHARLAMSRKSTATKKIPSKESTSLKVLRNRKGRSVRIDIHCHYLNSAADAMVQHLKPMEREPSVKFANAATRETNIKQMRDRNAKLSSIEVRLKDMDRMGIDIQVVSPAPFQYFYWAEPELGRELARVVNDGIAGVVARWPERFLGLGTVPLQNVELAVQELERCVNELGLRGVEINTNVNGMDLTDPKLGLDRFFAKAAELGAVIFMHPVGFNQGERLVDHYFNNVIGNPLESTIAVSHLIFDGVMARNPKLKVVVAHAGGYIAHYWGRMDHAWRARPDCRMVIKKAPSHYLKRFHFDTITFDPSMLRHMIDYYGADHVLLGTDYPYDMGEDDPIGLVESVSRLARADKEAIMGGNALRLLETRPARAA
jgi:aminocarboxymuconate-semialdehyde decarboxylase